MSNQEPAKIIGMDGFSDEDASNESNQKEETTKESKQSVEDSLNEVLGELPDDVPTSAVLSRQFMEVENNILESVVNKVKIAGMSLGDSQEEVQENVSYLSQNIDNLLMNKLRFEMLAKLGVEDIREIYDDEFIQSIKNGFKFKGNIQ